MPVIFKGGTSGNREDYTPPVPSSGTPQPVLNTATNGPYASTINLQSENFKPHPQTRTADWMPTGGTIPESSCDVSDPTCNGYDTNDTAIFKGAPNTGMKGGPAGPGR